MLDPNGIFTQYDYYPATGYLQRVIQDPGGLNAVKTFTYDQWGNYDHIVDAQSHTTDLDFNELGWLIQEKNPLNFVTKYEYDENGNLKKRERQANQSATVWQTFEYTYDIQNNLRTIKDPLNRVTTLGYDNNENLRTMTDAENHITSYDHDERDLIFRVTDANTPHGVTEHSFDINGNLKQIKDANNHSTNYEFDLFDRMFKRIYADNSFSQFTYDKNSNLIRHTKQATSPTGTRILEYDYDGLNRLVAKRFPNNASLNTTYQYDLGSRLNFAINNQQTEGFIYNNLNQLITTGQIYGAAQNLALVLYSNDKVGNRLSVQYPSGKLVEYTYDANDRMDLVKVNGSTIVDYDYDALDRRQTKSLPLASAQQTSYQYDITNQLTQLRNFKVGGALISQFDYTQYDNVGNRKTLDDRRGTQAVKHFNYNYNEIYELENVSGAQTHSFNYDNVGNRLVVDGLTYQPDNVNQYSTVGSINVLYDGFGNFVTGGNPQQFSYDEENRVASVNMNPGSISYAYDGLNRRISKTVNGTTTYFIYDGDEVIEERNANNQLEASYVLGNGLDEVLMMERGGSKFYYHYDGLGSVTDLTDANGNVIESYSYDVYGTPLNFSIIGNPYYFTGRRFDPETFLYYYRSRMYNSLIGRFYQRDPIGYADSMNLFEYVDSVGKPTFYHPNNFTNAYHYTLNNPVNFVDPYGLFTIQIGLSGTTGLRAGGSGGGGFVFGYSRKHGFQFGTYSIGGGGPFIGGSGSVTIDLTVSGNKHICELKGASTTVGGSGQFGASLSTGGEVNFPFDEKNKASFTGSFGYGIGTPEGHLFITDTGINPIFIQRK
jgi:RHS repeat-associated protein